MTQYAPRSFCLIVCLAWLLGPGALCALASPLFDLIGDSASSGGLQPRTNVGGSSAAYFNPALLVDAPAAVSAGFAVLSQGVGISLYARPGTEFAISEGLENARRGNGDRFDNYALPTNVLQFGRAKDMLREALAARPRQGDGSGHEVYTYEVTGLVLHMFEERFALAAHAMIPNGKFTVLRAFYNDEREQYFTNSLHPELYSDRLTALSLAFGAGLRLTKELSLGIGATLSLRADVGAGTYVVDTGNLGKILIDLDGGVNVSASPHFGLSYTFGERLRLVGTLHTPTRFVTGMGFTFLLANGIQQASHLQLLLDYTPWQAALGASFDVVHAADQTLSVSATALYAAWSDYVDRHSDTPGGAYAWADTLSGTLGVRFSTPSVAAAIDLGYTPSPVPKQTGRTNYVDNDRLSTSASLEYRFTLWGTRLRTGVQGQLHRLLPRYQNKLPTPTSPDGTNIAPERVKDELPDDARVGGEPVSGAAGLQTNNPGWPGFSSQGWIITGGLYVAVML